MAETTIPVPSLIRFGVFELDLRAAELRKNGAKLRLEGQPLQVLALLLENPGQLVTREELRGKLWPNDTFVDFEHSINTAVKKLRQTLGDSAETPRFIETLPRRGYRFVCPIGSIGSGAPVAAAPIVTSRRHAAVVLVLAVLVIAVTVAANLDRIRDRWFARPLPINSLAVLPLANLTGDVEQQFLVDGIHDELITQMAQIGSLKVISRTSVLPYRQPGQTSAKEIGEKLGVEALIEGTVQRVGPRVHLSIQLIHAPTDRHLWAKSYDGDLRDVLILQRAVVRDIASSLRIQLTAEEQARLGGGSQVDAEVYSAYLKGKYHQSKWTNESLWQAIREFQQALDRDPSYAPAWAAMGLSYQDLGSFAKERDLTHEDAVAKAKAALQRAVELDPTLKEPHQGLARIKRHEGDWQGAAQEFQRARELDPKWLGPDTYLLATGRYDEAVAASRQNAERNPLTYSVQLVHGWTCFMAGRYDESITQLKKTIQLDPTIHHAHYELAWNYIRKGMLKEAAAECDTALALLHRKQQEHAINGECGPVYAAAGRRQQALGMARQLAGAKGRRRFLAQAKIYDALGDRERALAYLRQAKDSVDSVVPLPDNRFLSDQLKADPRFQEIARKQPGFPPATGALAEVRAKALPFVPPHQP